MSLGCLQLEQNSCSCEVTESKHLPWHPRTWWRENDGLNITFSRHLFPLRVALLGSLNKEARRRQLKTTSSYPVLPSKLCRSPDWVVFFFQFHWATNTSIFFLRAKRWSTLDMLVALWTLRDNEEFQVLHENTTPLSSDTFHMSTCVFSLSIIVLLEVAIVVLDFVLKLPIALLAVRLSSWGPARDRRGSTFSIVEWRTRTTSCKPFSPWRILHRRRATI